MQRSASCARCGSPLACGDCSTAADAQPQWCNRFDAHKVLKRELVIRPVLQCTYCSRMSSTCNGCSTGAVRASPFIKHLYCTQCTEKSTYGDYTILLTKRKHSFGAFVPPRAGVSVENLIDGKDTLSAMAAAMEAAEKEILISFWLIVPKIRCGSLFVPLPTRPLLLTRQGCARRSPRRTRTAWTTCSRGLPLEE